MFPIWRLVSAVAAIITALAILVVQLISQHPHQPPSPPKDPVAQLYPSLPGGMSWHAQWSDPRNFEGSADPNDPWFTMPNSDATYRAGKGELSISGDVPRMYIRDPKLKRQWRNVEITMYFKRISDGGVPYAGMTSTARTNHGATGRVEDNLCDSRGLGGRVRYDGSSDFEKETSHPNNASTHSVRIWRGEMPKNVWIGYKYVVYDLPNGSVKMEIWLNQSTGVNAGKWVKVNQLVDNGKVFGDESCGRNIDPKMQLTSSTERAGSESGKPNLSIGFRSDGVGDNGLVYKYGSVREISAS